MACKGFVSAIRKFWNEITPELQIVINDVTAVTQKIKDLEGDATVEAIVAIIPGGSAVEAWINTALGAITGVTTEVSAVAAAITAWLNGASLTTVIETGNVAATIPVITKPAKDMMVFKLASQAVKAADISAGTANANKGDSFYDSAIQTHVIINQTT